MSSDVHCMIDIETLGTDPGCAILSIAAVEFDADDVAAGGWHCNIDLVSCEAAGLHIDADTLQWWLDQPDNARHVLSGGIGLERALSDLAGLLDACDADTVWANSPSFDLTILSRAYDAVGVEVPWEFYEERDFRTLKNLPCAVDVDREGVEHDALEDARHQARVASATLGQLDTGDTQLEEDS